MKTHQSSLTILLLPFFFAISKAENITIQPTDVFVKSGTTGYLNCTFDIPALGCYWSKDGTPITINQRYSYVGDIDTGYDCSIAITNSQIDHDDGYWQCGMPQSSETNAIKSNLARYVVLIKPDDPTMWKNENEQLLNKSSLAIISDENSINITCQSLNGNPVAKLKFKLGYSNIELQGELSFNKGSQEKYNSTELFVILPTNTTYNLENEVLLCIAEHPAYGINGTSYGKRFTYALTGTLHAPKNPIATVTGFDTNDIKVSPGFLIEISCSASSFLPINYKWLKRPSDSAPWEDYGIGENITFDAFQTQIICEATAHDDSVISNTTFSDIIYITLTSSSSAQTGTIVAIVVVCIVLVVAMVAAVYGLYKKKMLCFKVSKHDEEYSENTGNLSAAAHTRELKQSDLTNNEQTKSLIQENTNANPEESKPIIYADLQLQSPTNTNPPERIATEYASVKRPYGIQ